MSLAPRKVPRQPRARATYNTILEAAAHIIERHGLAGYNTNAVAERAGVSIGSLYQYFPNKDALMAALVERQQQRQLATLRVAAESIGPDKNLEVVVRMLVRAAMQHHRDDDLLASAIDHEEARLPLNQVLSAYLEQGGAVVAQLLEQRSDLVSDVDPQVAARTLPALVRAITDAWANLAPPQLDTAEEEGVRAVLGYLTCKRIVAE
jgi:AcrR family transcriptional regulator